MSDAARPKLLSGGNPLIPKGDGEAPVRAYIAAMPGWKSVVGQRLDALAMEAFPPMRKAVRWNTPFYGGDGGWFFSFYCYRKYVQVTFFAGTGLIPVPPKPSKVDGVRYYDIHEGPDWDAPQVAAWMRQAVRLPGVAVW